MRPKRKCVAKNQQTFDDGDSNKKRPKKICVEEEQQISDDGDKNQEKLVINSLDYDSLAKIIMFLPIPERIEIEKVCTKWKEACQLAWYDIKKYECKSSIGRCYDNRFLTQSYLEKILLRCGNYLKELSLSKAFTRSIIPFIGNHCKNLTSLKCKLNINWLKCYADDFVQAFTQLDKLKCIKITVDYYSNKTINLSAIINSLPEEIEEIHLFYNARRQQAISMTFKKIKNLKKLTLHGFDLDNIILQEIAETTTLVHLSIELYDTHIEFPLFDKLVNLEYIQITVERKYREKKVSTKVLDTIFCQCKNLKHLDIPNDIYDLAKISLEKWKNFNNLEYLRLSCYKVSPDLADTIVKYCKNLKHLCINSLCDIIETNVFIKLKKLENLEILQMNNNFLSEEAIIAISNNCKKLKRLELDDCTVISTDIVGGRLSSSSVLRELSQLQYLEHLSLSFTDNIEDSTIIAIANNCKNLKSLDIQGCRAITETALVALTNLENLQKLDVSFLDVITDSFVIKLKGLKALRCEGCQKLTDDGIIQFIENNPHLEFLDICSICIDITMNIVIAANRANKNRTNGIFLHLKTTRGCSTELYMRNF